MTTEFGCPACWPDDPDAAWSAWLSLNPTATALVQESHFSVKTAACTTCGQPLITVFVEEVDWVDGEDPQYWTVMPVTAGEVGQLDTTSWTLVHEINGLGQGRRCLRRDFPKGQDEPRCYWAPTFSAGPPREG